MAHDDLLITRRTQLISTVNPVIHTDPLSRRKRTLPPHVPPLPLNRSQLNGNEFTDIKLSPPRQRAYSVSDETTFSGTRGQEDNLSEESKEGESKEKATVNDSSTAHSSEALKQQQQKIEQLKTFFQSLKEKVQHFVSKRRQRATTIKEHIQQHEQYIAFTKQYEQLKQSLNAGVESVKNKAIYGGAVLRETVIEKAAKASTTNGKFNVLLSKLFDDFEFNGNPSYKSLLSISQNNDDSATTLFDKGGTEVQKKTTLNDPYKEIAAILEKNVPSSPLLFNDEKPLITELNNYEKPTTPRRRSILNQINFYEKAIIEGLKQANNAYTMFQGMNKQLADYLKESISSEYLQKDPTTRKHGHEVGTLYLQVVNEIDDGIALQLFPRLYELLLRQRKCIEKDLPNAETQSKEDLRDSLHRDRLSQQKNRLQPQDGILSEPLGETATGGAASNLPPAASSSSAVNNQRTEKKTSNPYLTTYGGQTFTLYPTACFRGTLERNNIILTNAQTITTLWQWIKFRRLEWGNNFPQNDGEYFNSNEAVDLLKKYSNVDFLRLTQLHSKNICLLSVQPCLLRSIEGEASKEDKEAVMKDTTLLIMKKGTNYFVGFRGKHGGYKEESIAENIIKQHTPYLFNKETYKGIALWPIMDEYLLARGSTSTTPLTVQRTLAAFEKQLRPLLKIMSHDILYQFHALKDRYEKAVEQFQQCEKDLNTVACQDDYKHRQAICDDLMDHIHRLMAFQAFSGKTLVENSLIDSHKLNLLTQVRSLYYTMQNYCIQNNRDMDQRNEEYTSDAAFLGYYSKVFTNRLALPISEKEIKQAKKEKTAKHTTRPLPEGGARLKQAIKKDSELITNLLYG